MKRWRKKGRTILAMSALSAAIFGSSLQAAEQEIDVKAGLGIPTGANNFNQSAKLGPSGGIDYLYALNAQWAVGGLFDYFYFPANSNRLRSAAGGFVDAHSKTNVFRGEALARYLFKDAGRWLPYAQLGVGATRFSQKTMAEPEQGSAWSDTGTRESRHLGTQQSTGFSATMTLGVQTLVHENWLIGAEAAWHFLGISHDKFGTGIINLPSVAVTLGYKFGRA